MWLAPITQMLALAAAMPQAGANSSPVMPEPIATRQTVFTIPYTIDRLDLASGDAVEVQLLVSTDGGRSQRLQARDRLSSRASLRSGNSGPIRRYFVFEADRDGEYWFWLRVVDRAGSVESERPLGPGLRVVVDTAPPTLKLEAQQSRAGQITVQWQVDEIYPRLDGHKVEYRTASDRPWQPVALSQRDVRVAGATQSGEASWWPEAGSQQVQIRVEVADKAGNRAVSHQQVELVREGTREPGLPGDPGHDAGTRPPLVAERPSRPWRADVPDTRPTPWPADQHRTDPSDWELYTGGNGTNEVTRSPYPGDNGANNLSNNNVPPPTGEYPQPYPPADSVPAEANPALSNRFVEPNAQSNPPAEDGWPPGVRPQMRNSRLLELDYDVGSVGPSGIGSVELWGTRDGGRTWRSYALDNDNRSPLLARVEGEGLYGFRVVVQSRAGRSDEPPRDGDRPDVWIGVDLTKPHANFLSIDRGTGPEAGKLVINWEAGDRMLTARPVSLFFRESAGGAWTPIATGLENTGRYVWTAERRLPEGVYFRLEVRDEAGNVGSSETTNVVSFDRFQPTGRISGVRSLGQPSPGTAQRRQDYR